MKLEYKIKSKNLYNNQIKKQNNWKYIMIQ